METGPAHLHILGLKVLQGLLLVDQLLLQAAQNLCGRRQGPIVLRREQRLNGVVHLLEAVEEGSQRLGRLLLELARWGQAGRLQHIKQAARTLRHPTASLESISLSTSNRHHTHACTEPGCATEHSAWRHHAWHHDSLASAQSTFPAPLIALPGSARCLCHAPAHRRSL